ncbi:MAG: tRNA (N(6)-L-threonylcarbamoyladenosine(37)-C(2))-methylthiotransferase MtaB [SAR202 cluster bacterium]|nr:tRNA (N(6)-L-threonylcarbamoyladenosine(37)-C(2))-methylthiotransferase MtaB [SAR202 cluster bacterium]
MTTQPTPSVAIETLGCKLNQADSLALAREFQALGYRLADAGESADVFVLNTCTVTHIADRKARRMLRTARRANPDATIVATGCYAQRSPADLRKLTEVDIVAGNVDKPTLARSIVLRREDSLVPCAVGDDATLTRPATLRTRAMVKIQEGCDQVCTYCIVPKVRGRERSISPDTLLAQVQGYAAEGYKEAVLTGTQLGSYGFDLGDIDLADLVARILDETDIARLRLSSLQPQEMTDELLRLWDNPRLCPHFHMPLQSGSDAVLRQMRRRYTAREYAGSVAKIRRAVPDASVTTDAICGFPGETDAMFEETLSLCREVGFADLHVFPYSKRPGTSAAYFDGHIGAAVKSGRVTKLMALAAEQSAAFRDGLVGAVRPVLWENSRIVGEAHGLTDNYVRVACETPMELRNRITQTRLVGRRGDAMVGELA